MYDFEIEPLCMPLSINVILKPKIVFNIIHFDRSSQVSALEPRIEYQYVILLRYIDSELMSGDSSKTSIRDGLMIVKFPLRTKLREMFE